MGPTVRVSAGAIALAAIAGMLCPPPAARAAAIRIDCKQKPAGKKQVSPELVIGPDDPIIPDPVAIVAITSASIRVVDSLGGPSGFGLRLEKAELTPEEAYGFSRTGGYTAPPPNNPSGPWVGLLWPYRDFNDGYTTPGTTGLPRGNEVGDIDSSEAGFGRYFVRNITGRMSYDRDVPATYQRGLPGNGAMEFARFFSLDVTPIDMTEREVEVFFEGIAAEVLYTDEVGRLLTTTVNFQNTSVRFIVPAPGTGLALGLAGLAALGRRRRGRPAA